jgi:hypothetical protein
MALVTIRAIVTSSREVNDRDNTTPLYKIVGWRYFLSKLVEKALDNIEQIFYNAAMSTHSTRRSR